MEDGVLRLSKGAAAVDELLGSVDNPIVLLNKSDLLPGKPSTKQRVLLRSGRALEASLVSLKSPHVEANLDII